MPESGPLAQRQSSRHDLPNPVFLQGPPRLSRSHLSKVKITEIRAVSIEDAEIDLDIIDGKFRFAHPTICLKNSSLIDNGFGKHQNHSFFDCI